MKFPKVLLFYTFSHFGTDRARCSIRSIPKNPCGARSCGKAPRPWSSVFRTFAPWRLNALPERMQPAVESGAKRILIPSETSGTSQMFRTPSRQRSSGNSTIHRHVLRSWPWGWGENPGRQSVGRPLPSAAPGRPGWPPWAGISAPGCAADRVKRRAYSGRLQPGEKL